jgi:putative FmdB family regulatory protein
MPIYDYNCEKCGDFEIIQSMSEHKPDQACPTCSGACVRVIKGTIYFNGASDWDTAHYNYALGEKCRNNKDAARKARARGWDEVGNDSPESLHKAADAERERKFKDSWDKAI